MKAVVRALAFLLVCLGAFVAGRHVVTRNLEALPKVLDIGQIKAGVKSEFWVPVRNVGSHPLTVEVFPPCGWTVRNASLTIPQGELSGFQIETIQGAFLPGKVLNTILVVMTQGGRKRFETVDLQGEVLKTVEVVPSEIREHALWADTAILVPVQIARVDGGEISNYEIRPTGGVMVLSEDSDTDSIQFRCQLYCKRLPGNYSAEIAVRLLGSPDVDITIPVSYTIQEKYHVTPTAVVLADGKTKGKFSVVGPIASDFVISSGQHCKAKLIGYTGSEAIVEVRATNRPSKGKYWTDTIRIRTGNTMQPLIEVMVFAIDDVETHVQVEDPN